MAGAMQETEAWRLLGVAADPDHVAAVKRILFASPRRTRAEVVWTDADREAVRSGSGRFPWLARYADTPAI